MTSAAEPATRGCDKPSRAPPPGGRSSATASAAAPALVTLDEDALAAIVAWVKSRPTAATEHLLLSLPRTGQPGPLSTRDIARIVGRHAVAADLPDDRRSPHVLRHTFCTHLADAGDTAVIRQVAGHADIRTTTIDTAVNPSRLEHAIAERGRQKRGARRAAA